MSDRAARIQGFFWTIASAVIFGLQPMISLTIYEEGANAIFVCWGRLAVATIGMALLCKFVFHRSFAITKKEFVKLLICAQGFALTPLFLYSSYNYMASGLATTVHFTYPVLVLLGCMVFLLRPMSAVKKFCCVLCFAGIAFMSDLSGGMSVTGFALSFISAIAFAGYIIYLDGSGLQEMHPAKLAAWLSLIGAVELFPLVLATGNMCWNLSPKGLMFLVLLGIASGCMASTFFQIGTKLAGPATASMLSTFEPITSIIVGLLVYHEVISLRSGIGAICILIAVLLVAWDELKEE